MKPTTISNRSNEWMTLPEKERLAFEMLVWNHFTNSEMMVPRLKKQLKLDLIKNFPTLPQETVEQIYRKAEIRYYKQLPKIPSEVLVQKIMEQQDYLVDKVLDESQEDATRQLKEITNSNKLIAQLNKLTDLPVNIEINFKHDMNEAEYINNNQVIEEKE